jgi:hypothetical protein
MEGKTTWTEVSQNDLYWLLDLNEALDVYQDMNDLDVRPPILPGSTGVSAVRFKGF